MSRNLLLILIFCLATFFGLDNLRYAEARTVIENERGSIFTSPYDGNWSGFGIYVGTPRSDKFSLMSPSSIKIRHTRFHIVRETDGNGNYVDIGTDFPYQVLKAYEDQEVAAGRAPFLVTATYQGKKRPVYWRWSINSFFAPYYKQAVNVGDSRYTKFYVDEYIRKIVWPGKTVLDPATEWVGIDEGAFDYDTMYGVIDDSGNFVVGVPWDPPFPQNKEEYFASLRSFFQNMRSYAPDITLAANLGKMDWNRFPEVFENVPAIMLENLRREPNMIDREITDGYFRSFQWFGEQGKIAILRDPGIQDNETSIRSAYAAYLIAKGENFFFNPRLVGSGTELSPSRFATMKSDLGNPVERYVNLGDYLYSRATEKGMVFYNRGAGSRTAVLPSNKTYHDRSGNVVAQLTINAGEGDYVLLDIIIPSVPVGLSANAISSSQIDLLWSTSTDNVAVSGYRVFRNNIQIGTSAVNSYQDTGLLPSTTYSYTIAAFDSNGNISAQSNSVSVTTPASPVVTPSPTPTPTPIIPPDGGGGMLPSPAPVPITEKVFPKTIFVGDKNSDVLKLQVFLSVSPQTGYFGPMTKSAVLEFQKFYNLQLTGNVDLLTLDKLNEIYRQRNGSPRFRFNVDLLLGITHSHVHKLQEYLSQYLDLYPEKLVTGYFGTLTQRAVQKFQVKYNIANQNVQGYGRVGPKTRAKLNELAN